MATSVRLCVVPAMLRCRAWTCDYCGGPCHHELRSSFAFGGMLGILVCQTHLDLGRRDIRASWHRQNLVKAEDLIAAFPELADSGIDPNSFAMVEKDGRWFVQSLSRRWQGALEDSIRARLVEGFYKADELAFQEARVLERERIADEKAALAAAEVGRALLRKAAKEKQKQEAVGRTRLGESKEEMLRRLTAVPGRRQRAVVEEEEAAPAPALATATAAEAVEDTDTEGWTTVGH